MKDAQFVRDGKTIITIATGEVQDFQTINAAKRKSRELQMSLDGRLGAGSVRTKRSHDSEADVRLLKVLQGGDA